TSVGTSVTITGGIYKIGLGTKIPSLTIENVPAQYANGSVCGATITGPMLVQSNGASVQMGSSAPLVCAPNAIGSTLTVTSNTGSTLMFGNSVGGNMQVQGNTGPVDVVGNTVKSTLSCQNNPALIMGSGNTAKTKQGQCS